MFKSHLCGHYLVSLKFGSEFDHVIADTLQTFGVKESKDRNFLYRDVLVFVIDSYYSFMSCVRLNGLLSAFDAR